MTWTSFAGIAGIRTSRESNEHHYINTYALGTSRKIREVSKSRFVAHCEVAGLAKKKKKEVKENDDLQRAPFAVESTLQERQGLRDDRNNTNGGSKAFKGFETSAVNRARRRHRRRRQRRKT